MVKMIQQGHAAAQLRLRAGWCLGHDGALNNERRRRHPAGLYALGVADAYIVKSKHQLGAMERARHAYAAVLAEQRRRADGGHWEARAARISTSTRSIEGTVHRFTLTFKPVCRWVWAR